MKKNWTIYGNVGTNFKHFLVEYSSEVSIHFNISLPHRWGLFTSGVNGVYGRWCHDDPSLSIVVNSNLVGQSLKQRSLITKDQNITNYRWRFIFNVFITHVWLHRCLDTMTAHTFNHPSGDEAEIFGDIQGYKSVWWLWFSVAISNRGIEFAG